MGEGGTGGKCRATYNWLICNNYFTFTTNVWPIKVTVEGTVIDIRDESLYAFPAIEVISDRIVVGTALGITVGSLVGSVLWIALGSEVGIVVGVSVGNRDGSELGSSVGTRWYKIDE